MKKLTKPQERMIKLIRSLKGGRLGDIALDAASKRVINNLIKNDFLTTDTHIVYPSTTVRVIGE